MCGSDAKLWALALANCVAATAAVAYLLLSRSSDALTMVSAAVILNAVPTVLLLQR